LHFNSEINYNFKMKGQQTSKIIIQSRFCGPPNSAHGGYTCGLLASFIDGIAEVKLRQPPPLEKELDVEILHDSTVILKERQAIVAEARPARLDIDVPEPPTYQEAEDAAKKYLLKDDHLFPTCFVCGPKRDKDDCFCIFAGPVAGKPMVASPWTPDKSLVDETGRVRPEFIWAGLDCPGAYAVMDTPPSLIMLGTFSADIKERPYPGDICITIGWEIAREGKKRSAGTALFSKTGKLLGKAKAIWIEINS